MSLRKVKPMILMKIGFFDNWPDEDEDDERDADALFYKECGLKPAKSKSGKSNSKSARKGK